MNHLEMYEVLQDGDRFTWEARNMTKHFNGLKLGELVGAIDEMKLVLKFAEQKLKDIRQHCDPESRKKAKLELLGYCDNE